MMHALIGALVVAAVATAGDYIWYEYGVQHRMIAGIVHGVVLLTALGGVLGALAGRLAAGLPIGAVAGLAGALTYYAVAPVMRTGAMLVAWTTLWIVMALLGRRTQLPDPARRVDDRVGPRPDRADVSRQWRAGRGCPARR